MDKKNDKPKGRQLTEIEKLFIANRGNRGKPVQYKGRSIVPLDDFPVVNGDKLKIVFERTNSDWRQGVRMRVTEGNASGKPSGMIVINGLTLKLPVLWHDTIPPEMPFEIKAKKNTNHFLTVYNVWDTGNGRSMAWERGAAMEVHEIESGRRYLCNDGHPDEDFDDLIFRIERIVD